MATIRTHNYGAMLKELNRIIIAEVKAALQLLPKKEIGGPQCGESLCRVIVGPEYDYYPRDLSVRHVWLNGEGKLCFDGYESHNGVLTDYLTQWDEHDSLYDITDMEYLVSLIADCVKGDKAHDVRVDSRLGMYND